MRRVLFLAHNFPPHGGAGVQRSLKFVKYLPEFGWQPVVIAATPEAARVVDHSLLEEIPPQTEVRRVQAFSIVKLERRLQRVGLRRLAVALNILLQAPDAVRPWARAVRPVVEEVLASRAVDLVYSTSGPFSAHLAGAWAHRRFEIPWLADFRDPWSGNLLMPYPPGYRALNRAIERRILAEATCVTCVSRPWLDDLHRTFGHSSDKFHVLPNGFDEDDVESPPLPPRGEQLIITHLGSIYRNRRPDQVISALDGLISSGKVPPEQIKLRFIGKEVQRSLPELAQVKAIDYVPHSAVQRYRNETHVLLLILDTSKANIGNYSGKIYEYLASNRPILAVVPRGGVAEELIRITRTGLTVGGRSEEIADAIATLHRQWQEERWDWAPDREEIKRHTRKERTARLAGFFDDMVVS